MTIKKRRSRAGDDAGGLPIVPLVPALSEFMKWIADAIRAMDKTSAPINPMDFPDRIRAIKTGVETNDATAAAEDIIEGKTAYVKEKKVTGTMPLLTGVNATFSPEHATDSHGTYDVKYLLTGNKRGYTTPGSSLGGITYPIIKYNTTSASYWTPTTADLTIISSRTLYYFQSPVVMLGSPYLVSSNIRSGVNIFGVSGSLSPITYTSVYLQSAGAFLYEHANAGGAVNAGQGVTVSNVINGGMMCIYDTHVSPNPTNWNSSNSLRMFFPYVMNGVGCYCALYNITGGHIYVQ